MSSEYSDLSFPEEPQIPSVPQLQEDNSGGVPLFGPNEVGSEQPVIEEQPIPLASPEPSLPPEAQGEANGGPLGCCLGTVVGVFLTALIIMTFSIMLTNGGFLGFATIPILFVGTVLGGYFGWRIGKRLYREYKPPAVKERPYTPYRPRRTSKARVKAKSRKAL